MRIPIRLIVSSTSLHAKLMLTLAILLTLIVAFVTYVLLEHERENRFMELETRSDRMTDLASRSVAYSVWNVDLKAIDELLASLSSDPEVAQLTITAVGYGKLREITKPMGPLVDPIVRIQDINFETAETGSQKIGEIRVVLTRTLVEQGITIAQRAVWVMVVLILVLLYAATYVLFSRMVSDPINRLETTVDRIAFGDLNARCTIESEDELGQLAMRVNTMADRLQESDRSLRDSETRLKLVLDGSQLGSWDWDIETGEVIRDVRWAEMLGYTLEEVEYSVKQWSDLHHPDDKTLAWNSINAHLEGYTPAHEIEYRMRTKDGQYKWILDQAKVVKWDAQGKALRMCGTHKDITERKRAEQEQEKLQNQSTQAQKMESIGTLAGGVAHEINNPVNGIMNYAQLIKDKIGVSNSITEFADEIIHETQRVSTIVRNLLTFARDEKDSHSPARLEDILNAVLSLVQTIIRKDQIQINVNIPSDLPKLKCRSQQIQQVIMNLLTNARDALNEKYPGYDENKTIAIQTTLFQKNNRRWIRTTIEDHGPGIPQKILDRIFDPFYTTKPKDKGTGLGLSISHGIVKDHHGELSIDSEPGQYTKFHLDLPVDNGWDLEEKSKRSMWSAF